MKRLFTRLDGPALIAPRVIGDERGFFCETYRRTGFSELGIPEEMVQDNHSRSRYGIVRGMHFQIGEGAAKLDPLRPRRDLRRDGRPARRLADLWAVGGVRADRGEHAHGLLPDRLWAWLLRAQRHRRRDVQAEQLLR